MIKAKKHLDDFKPYLLPPGKWVNKVRLNLNESRWNCTPKFLEALKTLSPDEISNYPQYGEITEKVASFHGVDPKRVLVSNGADDAINCIMEAFIEPGDKIVCASPTYPMYPIMGSLKGAEIVEVPYQGFEFPVEGMLAVIDESTRMVVIVNPDNPSGVTVSRDDIIRIFEKACNAVLVLDEAYYQFNRKSHTDLIDRFENLITVHTFSKAYGMAGLRLGYALSFERHILSLQKVILPLSINSLAVTAGLYSLDDKDFIERVVSGTEEEKQYIRTEMQRLSVPVRDTKTNFLLLDFGNDHAAVNKGLISRDVLLRNVSKSELLKGYLRLTIGTRKENELFVKALKETLADVRGKAQLSEA